MYRLPKGGGGGGNNNGNGNDLRSVASGVLTILGTVAFFASPLGGIVLAIANSFLLLLVLTPVVLTVAFRVWEKFNVVEGPCPGCGAPAKAIKGGTDTPSVCFNCGAFVKSSPDGKTVEFASEVDRNDVVVDAFEGGGYAAPRGTGSTIFDQLFSPTSPSPPEEKERQYRREQTVIDVEVEQDNDKEDRRFFQ